jgi:DNA-binding NarL/FixJ family response regulator
LAIRPATSTVSLQKNVVLLCHGILGGGVLAALPVKVLVVDDFEPFRQFVLSMLGEKPELQIIGEASDGFEAVQKAEALRPDLILLDVGLPTLNGIEAARRIRRLVQKSKIVFVSQESSADVVEEAFRLGAKGYVVKTDAGRDLLIAVSAVLRGETFASTGLAERNVQKHSVHSL